jgi:heterodisulfide reductase subunit A
VPEKNSDIGVFLCDCGGKISNKIDFSQLSNHASLLNNVKTVKRHEFLCGDEGQAAIKTAIKDGIGQVVIGACSPKLYEKFFMQLIEESGLNPYFLEIANLREQCAWVHNEVPAVNEKAKRMMSAAVENVRRAKAINANEFKVEKSALIIGGGVAGLQAAMDIADFGYEVNLIERAPVVGGNSLKLGIAFPTDDGAFCISSPDYLKGVRKCFYRAGLLQHPHIKIQTLSNVEEINGSFGNFEAKISSQPRGVQERLCINCTKCADVCPVDVADEMNYGANTRKAIYLPHPNAVPPVYIVDWENCNKCGKCVDACPTKAIDLSDEKKECTVKAGAIIIASGFQEYDPSDIKQYKHGLYKDVITQLQLARILDTHGSSKGKLVKPSDGSTPKTIVMMQCVGSRDVNANSYCSKICCTIALKHAIFIKEKHGQDTEIYICYMDIRTLGKNYEDYYTKARELGVKFIRGKPSEVIKDLETGKLLVEVEDTLLNKPLELEADLIVLSAGMIPSLGNKELAETLGVELGENGFIKEVYPKLKPIETAIKGIYVCGGAQGPKDIPESVTQAEATAFRAILDLSKTNYSKDMDIAYVEEDDCDGCELCLDACPYDALQMVDVKGKGLRSDSIVEINAIRCERCGSCAGRCPTGALQLQNYTDDQILAQIHELLSKDTGSMTPKVIAFCCNECGYATVDMAGMAGMTFPPNVFTLRIPCLGWVSPYYIFKAFEQGADGILLVGCISGNCQQVRGNIYADKVVKFAKDILNEIGLSDTRLKMTPVCAMNPLEFSEAATSLVDEVGKLGSILQSDSAEDDLAKTAIDIREGKIDLEIDVNSTGSSTNQPDLSRSHTED